MGNPFVEFRERYYHAPVLYVQEVLGGAPDADQCAILQAVAAGERRISIRSGHGVGKTTVLAWIICWWLCTRFPQKGVCTAPTSDQLFDALGAETKTWMGRMPPTLRDQFEVQAEKIFFKEAPAESFIGFKTSRPDKPEAIAGMHAPHVLIIADEASGVPDAVYDAGSGSMSGESAVTILAGNPIRSSGLFYDTHHSLAGSWKTFHISCIGHPRIAVDFIDDKRRQYGEQSNEFRVRVLGEFPLADDDTIIAAGLVELALTRDTFPLLVKEIWGVDVARFGIDCSALARRQGNVLVKPVEEKYGYDTMKLVGWVKSEYDLLVPTQRPSDIMVDVIGVGAGVCDRLCELGLPARGINVAETPALFDDRYDDQRTELWFKGAAWFERMDCNIKNDRALMTELIAQRYDYTSDGKRKAKSKREMKTKYGHLSPNKADAFLLTLAGDAVTAIGYGRSTGNWSSALKRPGVM